MSTNTAPGMNPPRAPAAVHEPMTRADKEHDVLGSRVHITGPARHKLGADLKKAYDKGASIRILAEGCGRSYGFIHRLLTEAGTALRTRGRSNNQSRTAR